MTVGVDDARQAGHIADLLEDLSSIPAISPSPP
jgi:hypothetical protein